MIFSNACMHNNSEYTESCGVFLPTTDAANVAFQPSATAAEGGTSVCQLTLTVPLGTTLGANVVVGVSTGLDTVGSNPGT